ncbi:hypothetical protein LIER_07019 [Lithospermum erythrorhizon]|uniref:Uncharacterized protein n=1 Tax=Lithospermum erythrorhizon TaxID=34254 RepID=A0AAV3PBB8_LITER
MEGAGDLEQVNKLRQLKPLAGIALHEVGGRVSFCIYINSLFELYGLTFFQLRTFKSNKPLMVLAPTLVVDGCFDAQETGS